MYKKINKLFYEFNTITKEYFNINRTIIFIDWDDTVFPTTFLNQNNENYEINKYIFDFYRQNYFDSLKKIIDKLQSYGTIYVVTNATLSWLKLCINNYPELEEIFYNIELRSAQDEFFSVDDIQGTNWKYNLFNKILESENIDKSDKNNIISIGDGPIERNSILRIKHIYNNSYVKSVKLNEMPNISCMIYEFKKLYFISNKLINYKKDIDIVFRPI